VNNENKELLETFQKASDTYIKELLAGNHHRAIDASIEMSSAVQKLNLASALNMLADIYPKRGSYAAIGKVTSPPSTSWDAFLAKRKLKGEV
jgi:hypothetical protein